MALRTVVIISGGGSNLADLLHRIDSEPHAGVEVVAVGADREASGLEHARQRDIPTFVTAFASHSSRESWGDQLIADIDRFQPDLVVLSGLMRLVPDRVVARYTPALINTHPAYLPEFPGAHAVADQIAAGVSEAGASVIVVDQGIDTGPILAQERVPVRPDDTIETLHSRIKEAERHLLWPVLLSYARGERHTLSRKDPHE